MGVLSPHRFRPLGDLPGIGADQRILSTAVSKVAPESRTNSSFERPVRRDSQRAVDGVLRIDWNHRGDRFCHPRGYDGNMLRAWVASRREAAVSGSQALDVALLFVAVLGRGAQVARRIGDCDGGSIGLV